MNDGEIGRLRRWHMDEEKAVREVLDKVLRRHNDERKWLEERCLLEHGAHQDDGGYMHGFCTRCGAFLG